MTSGVCFADRWTGRSRRGRRTPAALAATLGAALLLAPMRADAQAGSVGGVIVDEQSLRPLPSVQVAAEGTGRGAVTDASGRFLITNVPGDSATLRAVLIGYRPLTSRVRVGDTALRLTMARAPLNLDEIVVTGTAGDARTRAVGNAIAQIDAADVVARAPVTNVQELINGRAPGVVITQPTGMVGGGSRIRIRGISSLSLGDQPLIYVDGVRVDNDERTGPAVQGLGVQVVSRINDINPEDIASIEILKGPAAATLYGTEASNGVIQIITKRGTVGAPRWDLKIRQAASWFADPEGRIPETYGRNRQTGEIETLNIVARERSQGRDIFRTGHSQGYDLSVSGGAQGITYYLGGGYDDEEGIERENGLRRLSGRANIGIAPSEQIEITGSIGYSKSQTSLVYEASGGGTMWATLYAAPNLLTLANGDPSPLNGFRTATPQVYYDAFDAWQDVARFTGSVQVTHRPVSWFSHRLAAGTDQTSEQNGELTERSNEFEFFFGELLGDKFVTRRDVSYNTLDYSGTGTFGLRDDLVSNTTVGGQYYRRFTEAVTAIGEQFPAAGLTVVDAAAVRRGGEDFFKNTTVGVFVQQQLAWRDRLFLTGALRADDNSAFGENFDLVYYPKVSASWVVSEEPFWSVPFVSALKLRGAYGQSGLQPAAFDALRTYAPVTGRGDAAAVTPGTVGNPDLGPERGEELELGLDAGFANGRLGVEFTWYDQRTRDAILLRQIAPSTGFVGSQFVNVGEISNRGIELLVDGLVIDRPNVAWNVSASLSTNDNEVVSLGEGLTTIVSSAQFGLESRIGYPVASLFNKRIVSAEVNAAGRAVNVQCDDGAGGALPCAQAPAVYMGRTLPKYEGAVTSSLTLFEHIRLGALVDYKTGHHKFEGNVWVRCAIFLACEENLFPQEADPIRLAAFQNGSNFAAPVYIQDASFARLREVSATFTLPTRWAARVGASTAAITVAGRNLVTWTDYPGLDPEGMFAGSGYFEQNNLPLPAQFVTTFNVSF